LFSQNPVPAQKINKINTKGYSKLSASTSSILLGAKQKQTNNLDDISFNSMLRVMVKFKKGCNEFSNHPILKNINLINQELGTAFVKISELPLLENEECVLYIDAGETMSSEVDNARASTNVDEVHTGVSTLNNSYKGNGVLVGIIDSGFDYNHINFKDEDGNFRITRIWNQSDNSGWTPVGFDYGTQLYGYDLEEGLDEQLPYDTSYSSHGTHVAGIAAGKGINPETVGMAPESEIILVKIKSVQSDFPNDQFTQDPNKAHVSDAISYLVGVAQSLQMPLVINMSFGTNQGPHDGTDLLSQSINSISENNSGVIIFKSAGNDGDDDKHVELNFENLETKYIWTEEISSQYEINNSERLHYIDFWGDNQGINSAFTVNFGVYDRDWNEYDSEIWQINVNGSYLGSIDLIDDDFIGSDDWSIDIFSEINPLNQRPHLRLKIETDNDDDDDNLLITITSQNTTVHAWVNSGKFISPDGYDFVTPDGFYSVTEPGNADGLITVAAYNVTDTGFGEIENISDFSSRGPRIDGALTPDIAAPGSSIVSSINSYHQEYMPGGFSFDDVVYSDGTAKFALSQGTSMAAPVAAGITALWLEAYPNLTTADVRYIIQETAKTDEFTESFITTPNRYWGYGKIDALAGLQLIESSLFLNDYEHDNFILYPNPTNDYVNFDNSTLKFKNLEVINLIGQSILKLNLEDSNQNKLDISNFEKGLYLFKFSNKNDLRTFKIIKE
jgi:subtilisin family serine protease